MGIEEGGVVIRTLPAACMLQVRGRLTWQVNPYRKVGHKRTDGGQRWIRKIIPSSPKIRDKLIKQCNLPRRTLLAVYICQAGGILTRQVTPYRKEGQRKTTGGRIWVR